MTFDVIVIGVGGMGSSACFHLANRKKKVLGIEQFSMGHSYGSSHGETRMIRQAYFEHPDYVPLLRRAYENWAKLEADSDQRLFEKTGVVYGLDPNGEVYRGVTTAAKTHGIAIEEGAVVRGRFEKYFTFEEDERVLFEPNAGFLYVEKCVSAYADSAVREGAHMRFEEQVMNIRRDGRGFQVTTNKDRYFSEQVVVTAGPWIANILPDLKSHFRVLRKTLWWYESSEIKMAKGAPCFFFDGESTHFYGFPDFGTGLLKCAVHSGGDETTMDNVNRSTHAVESPSVQVRHRLKIKNQEPVQSAVCLYTMTKDGHFAAGPHPSLQGLVVMSPCSGHGFKFASVMGEIAADYICDGKTVHPTGFLRMERFL